MGKRLDHNNNNRNKQAKPEPNFSESALPFRYGPPDYTEHNKTFGYDNSCDGVAGDYVKLCSYLDEIYPGRLSHTALKVMLDMPGWLLNKCINKGFKDKSITVEKDDKGNSYFKKVK